ncbi:MAG: YfcE family phosphodiesterase [Proteobacteria bacterium]|nr:YfcE family phosphodiesterase [Desulfobacula sp.]MBU4129629.1 YfcE family phosphodiesterase [Pseudomonadota bacterium]
MSQLFITADIHGSFGTWLSLKKLMAPGDGLVIAGDLFDTRYGNYSNTDFQPESIKKQIPDLSQKLYYVYGNCDQPSFYPDHGPTLGFRYAGKMIFLHHGHENPIIPNKTDIIIQGHTHLCSLERQNSQIFMNPGSLTSPRNQLYTYGIIDEFQARIMELNTGNCLAAIAL